MTQGIYFYRVDATHSLREMAQDQFFRPARWDNNPSRWKHASLLAEQVALAVDEGIFRISFWNDEESARSDLAMRRIGRPHSLLRVAREAVAESLKGWRFDDDDYLLGKASLIWRRGEAQAAHVKNFYNGGVPTSVIEVWDDEKETWRPWQRSALSVPDAVRMASIGWHSTALVTRQGGGVVAYWQVVQLPIHQTKLWCLLTLDERATGTLGGEDVAVLRFVESLLSGPIRNAATAVEGVLTIHPGEDRLWTEQFVISSVVPPKPGRWFGKRGREGDGDLRWHVRCQTVLPRAEEQSLIEASGLRYGRPELPDRIWAFFRSPDASHAARP